MWLVLGISAIVAGILNIVFASRNKANKWFGFISLSLTALTVCAFYSGAANMVVNQDISGLLDVVPTMSKALWVLVIASILINGLPKLKEN